jgi:hypothetical protein
VSSTWNRPKTPHHPPVTTGDIFSGIDRVDQGIVESRMYKQSIN